MKKTNFILLFVALVAYLAYGLFEEEKPKPSYQKSSVSAKKQQTSAPISSIKTGKGQWPFINASSDLGALSDSLVQKNFVMIFDGSGSMRENGCSGNLSKIEVAKKVVIDWASTVPVDANLGLIVFDQNGFSTRLPLGLKNRDNFKEEIAKVLAGSTTPLTKSLNTAFEMLTKQGQKQLSYGEYSTIIVTDGIANDARSLQGSVDKVLKVSPIMINTIGFCIDGNHALNNKGRTIYKAANNPKELKQGLEEVLAESKTFDLNGFE